MGALGSQQARCDPQFPRCGYQARAQPCRPDTGCCQQDVSLMAAVYVAVGSNVEPERHLSMATGELRREFPDVRFSPWYRNRAVGFEGADFINLVAGFTTTLSIEAVIARLQAIEA